MEVQQLLIDISDKINVIIEQIKTIVKQNIQFHHSNMVIVDTYIYLRSTLIAFRYLYTAFKIDLENLIDFLQEYWDWELIKSGNFLFTILFALFVFLYKKTLLTHDSLDISSLLNKIAFSFAILLLVFLLLLEIARLIETKEKIEELNFSLSLWSFIKKALFPIGLLVGLLWAPIRLGAFVLSFSISIIIDIFSLSKLEEAIENNLAILIAILFIEFTAFSLLYYLAK